MSDSRIELLGADEARAATAEAGVPEYMADLNIFRALLHHPQLARRFNDLLAFLIFKGALDDRLRELIIMRMGWRTACDYEWTQHWRIAAGLGVSEADLLATRGDWASHPGFSDADRAVLAATDEVLDGGAVTAATWEACVAHVGDSTELMEMLMAIGAWRMVSSFLRSAQIPLEDGVPSWPPDGQGPTT